jgi:EmrB/QacA subfamily drug resistance transporter
MTSLSSSRKWFILAAITSCIAMIFIDITVLPIALPTIHRELDLSQAGVQWIISAYTLSLTVFVVAGGKIGDMFGLRKIFCLGLLVFALSSAFCAASFSEAHLVIGRIFQGIGGAILIPTSSAILMHSFPVHQRGRAMGIYVSVGSIFLALGPFIGGICTEYASWRLIFLLNLPIAGIGLLLSLLFIPIFEKKKEFLDWVGLCLLAISLTCLITPLMQSSDGFFDFSSIWLFLVGVLGIATLLCRETRLASPLLELHLFKNRIFLGGSLNIIANQFQLMITVFWAIYFQTVLSYSPSEAGSLAFLANAPVLLFAPLAGFMVDRFGPRLPVMIGFALVLFSLIWLAWIPKADLKLLLFALIPYGCGIPLIFTPSYTSSMNQVSEHKRGLAAGIISTLRQFSSTLGLALFGSFFYNIQNKKFADFLKQDERTAQLDPTSYKGLLSQVPSAIENAAKLPLQTSEKVYLDYTASFIEAFSGLNLLAAGIAFLGLLSAFFILKRPKAL